MAFGCCNVRSCCPTKSMHCLVFCSTVFLWSVKSLELRVRILKTSHISLPFLCSDHGYYFTNESLHLFAKNISTGLDNSLMNNRKQVGNDLGYVFLTIWDEKKIARKQKGTDLW